MKSNEEIRKSYRYLKELAPNLSPNDLARICLLITRTKSEIYALSGEEMLKSLNDPSFQQDGFHTFFPSFNSEKIVQIVRLLGQYNPDQLRRALLNYLFRFYAEDRSALFSFPPQLFDTAFPDFKPAPGDRILIPLVENSLELALNLATKFSESNFTMWFESADTRGILSFLFGDDMLNVRFEQVSVRELGGTFSGFDYVIAFPPFGGRLPRQVTSRWKQESPATAGIKSVPRVDADLYIQRMLGETEDRARFIVMVPELLMYSHGSFKEIRDHLSKNNRLLKVVRLSKGVLQPFTTTPLIILEFTNYPQSSETMVEVLRIEPERPRRARSSQYLVTGKKSIDAQTLSNSEVWDFGTVFFLKSPVVNFQQIDTLKLEEVVLDVFRGPSTESPKRGSPSKIQSLRVVGLSEMDTDIIDIDSLTPSEVGLNTPPDRYLLQNNDIVLTCRGTIMKISVIKTSGESKAMPSNNVAVVRVNPEIIDPYYLYIFFDSRAGKQFLLVRQSGATQKFLSPRDLISIEIPKLPIIEQRKIAQEFRDGVVKYEAAKRKIEEEFQKTVGSVHQKMGLAK